jgi:hypothetical protein
LNHNTIVSGSKCIFHKDAASLLLFTLTWLGGWFSGSVGAVASLEAELAKKTWIFNKTTMPASELRHKHTLPLDYPPKLQIAHEQ